MKPMRKKKTSFCFQGHAGKGQVSSEALVVLLAFFAVLSQLAVLELGQVNKASALMRETRARAISEKNAMAIDAVSANPGSIAFNLDQKCHGSGTRVLYCSKGEQNASAPTIAVKIETIQKGKLFNLRLDNEPHYG